MIIGEISMFPQEGFEVLLIDKAIIPIINFLKSFAIVELF